MEKFLILEEFERKVYLLGELSSEEYEELDKAKNIIDILISYKRRIDEILINHSEYVSFTIHDTKEFIEKEPTNRIELDGYVLEINRRLINFINSFKSFFEYLEKNFKNRYGKESIEYEKLKKYTGGLYDTYFSYKFFTHLRNFAAHNDYPIHNANFDFVYEPIFSLKIDVFFVKSHLLGDRTLKGKIEKDLKKYGEIFPIDPLLKEILAPLNGVFSNLLKIEKDHFERAVNIIESYFGEMDYKKTYHYGISTIIDNKYIKDRLKEIPNEAIEDFHNWGNS